MLHLPESGSNILMPVSTLTLPDDIMMFRGPSSLLSLLLDELDFLISSSSCTWSSKVCNHIK